MSRVAAVNGRYQRAAALAKGSAELIAIVDPAGARVDAAVRSVTLLSHEDRSGLWDDLVGPARALRWRALTQPQPIALNSAVRDAAEAVIGEAGKLTFAVGGNDQRLLGLLTQAARDLAGQDPAVGEVLLASIAEVGADACVVIAASNGAASGLGRWLGPFGIAVHTVSEMIRGGSSFEQAYAIGPPRFIPRPLLTAPMTDEVAFLIPDWFKDQSVPLSPLAEHAAGALNIKIRRRLVGVNPTDPDPPAAPEVAEELLLPQPVWSRTTGPRRQPGLDEVEARKVLLSGGYSIMLDDGDRIRAVDPEKPGGERVVMVDVNAVKEGTYLLLRAGLTERQTLYDAALGLMGSRASSARTSQARWKGALQARLDQHGVAAVERDLAAIGVSARSRVRAWPDPLLIRPMYDHDFELLLQWLRLPVHPTFDLATDLSRRRAQASADVGSELEAAVGRADMAVLHREGHLRLDAAAHGFRGVVATRVLAASPEVEIVHRNNARLLTRDRGVQWLE
ncbi:hypothetical protein [Pseudofrankia inefficax]|uniref:Uncharacterized protein n=1 Tax=Pseudofrankia inefficax (strain DSM 45817 / CECT 9037 / DDB 130130 / EuI1c) TaxID=298654 RepID=E3IVZ5_PSEI1|nr:hypothetical protein [Pseudofrankia inefficax]ADP84923.1 hypothetical protein FraEuI1c_6955 [Pseudofrankia inefficax]